MPELTAQEVAQVEVLILRYYSTANDSFITKRLLEDQGYDIVLLKEGEEVLAVSFYHLTKKRGGLVRENNMCPSIWTKPKKRRS